MIWPMESRCDEPTRAMLERASSEGPEREAMSETHGQVSIDRAPHQELRKHYGHAYLQAWWEANRVEWRDEVAS